MSIYLHQPAICLSVSLEMQLQQAETSQLQLGPSLSYWAEQALQTGADRVHCRIRPDNAAQRLALLSTLDPYLLSLLECQLEADIEFVDGLVQLMPAACSLSGAGWLQLAQSRPMAPETRIRLGLAQLQQLRAAQFESQFEATTHGSSEVCAHQRLLQLQLTQTDLEQAGDMASLCGIVAEASFDWRVAGYQLGVTGDLTLDQLLQLIGRLDLAVVCLEPQLLALCWQHGWSRAIGMARAALRHSGVTQ